MNAQTPTVDEAIRILDENARLFIFWPMNSGRFDLRMQGVANRLGQRIAVWQQRDETGEWFWLAIPLDSDSPCDECPCDPAYPYRKFRVLTPRSQ